MRYCYTQKLKRIFKTMVILFVILIDAYPIFWLFTSSLKSPAEFVVNPSYALPESIYLKNYAKAWSQGNMGVYFRNSLVYTIVALVFIVILSITVGFALTKMEWKGRNLVSSYFLLGLMIPVTTSLIPLVKIFRSIHIINTGTCLILTYIVSGLSMSIFLTTSYMRALPNDMFEASVIDGCSIFTMMRFIVMPVMKNCIVTIVVLQFFYKWNDLLFSMTFISDKNLKTLQTGLLYFEDQFGTKDWGAIFASVSISVFPLLIVYMFLNKKVIEGMTSGAVKG